MDTIAEVTNNTNSTRKELVMESARWRLTNPHYLNVEALSDGTEIEYEHKETSRENGRTIRKTFKVPILLTPSEPNDCNYPGEIIVANAHSAAYPKDIVFHGSPTREMEPLNDAAQAISDSMRSKWDNPIESLPSNGGMNSQEQVFLETMMKAFAAQAPAPNASVPIAQYDELKDRLAKLEAMIAAQAKPATTAERRA